MIGLKTTAVLAILAPACLYAVFSILAVRDWTKARHVLAKLQGRHQKLSEREMQVAKLERSVYERATEIEHTAKDLAKLKRDAEAWHRYMNARHPREDA